MQLVATRVEAPEFERMRLREQETLRAFHVVEQMFWLRSTLRKLENSADDCSALRASRTLRQPCHLNSRLLCLSRAREREDESQRADRPYERLPDMDPRVDVVDDGRDVGLTGEKDHVRLHSKPANAGGSGKFDGRKPASAGGCGFPSRNAHG